MSRPLRELWVGLDWGTHSSKWWFTGVEDSGRTVRPENPEAMIDSTIYRMGQELRLVRERMVLNSDVQDPRLKRLLLQDPLGASFWEARREGIGISLGDAATLSLAVLLGDTASSLEKRGLGIIPEITRISLVYSLPNWIHSDNKHQAARRRMFQTTVVLGGLLSDVGFAGLPHVNGDVDLEEWASMLNEVRQSPACHDLFDKTPTSFAALIEHEFRFPGRVNVSWRLAPESGAAGFPQLLQLLKPPEETKRTQDHWVKLLVVDVGAGSTDAGYFISSRRSNGALLLNYLRPAPTLDYAGEQLTERLQSFYRHRKQREITIQEAETIKLSAPEEWAKEDFVRDWRSKIADHVADYMRLVPDELRLGQPAIPGLKIVMTGGSGLVEGLAREIRTATIESLAARGIAGNVAKRTEISDLLLDWPEDRVDRARRAVSVGAGDSGFAQLKYREKFEIAAPAPGPIERW